jgi:hypothetical protein
MTMRHHVEPSHPQWPVLELPVTQSCTTIDPLTLNTHGLFGFIVQWQLPGVTHGRMIDDDGQPAVFLLARDGSRAEVTTTPTTGGYPVRQYGPQRLWDRVEHAATFWTSRTDRPTSASASPPPLMTNTSGTTNLTDRIAGHYSLT